MKLLGKNRLSVQHNNNNILTVRAIIMNRNSLHDTTGYIRYIASSLHHFLQLRNIEMTAWFKTITFSI